MPAQGAKDKEEEVYAAYFAFLVVGLVGALALELLPRARRPRSPRILLGDDPPLVRTYDPELASVLNELAPHVHDGRRLLPRLAAHARRLGLRRLDTPHGALYACPRRGAGILARKERHGWGLFLVRFPLEER